ncbi:hypothetical protein L1N85_21200 [Paenibacillus alkaliterrae]|uniref:hypothetical protein n=1 Tax=Paenibacillus alkaliterrae TaxID=320909 RepID=UPI001F1DD403|nr:hypothetical protein [Paenibacillus alkaliterrae]MCF2940909.1 hypothetical protein [Paenibacillus alkaliterrae]
MRKIFNEKGGIKRIGVVDAGGLFLPTHPVNMPTIGNSAMAYPVKRTKSLLQPAFPPTHNEDGGVTPSF